MRFQQKKDHNYLFALADSYSFSRRRRWLGSPQCSKCATTLSNNKSVKINICAQTMDACVCVPNASRQLFHSVFQACKLCSKRIEWNGAVFDIDNNNAFLCFSIFFWPSFVAKEKKSIAANVRYCENKEQSKRSLSFCSFATATATAIVSISADVNEFICFVLPERAYLLYKINIL